MIKYLSFFILCSVFAFADSSVISQHFFVLKPASIIDPLTPDKNAYCVFIHDNTAKTLVPLSNKAYSQSLLQPSVSSFDLDALSFISQGVFALSSQFLFVFIFTQFVEIHINEKRISLPMNTLFTGMLSFSALSLAAMFISDQLINKSFETLVLPDGVTLLKERNHWTQNDVDSVLRKIQKLTPDTNIDCTQLQPV
jgi:hypothetical protein